MDTNYTRALYETCPENYFADSQFNEAVRCIAKAFAIGSRIPISNPTSYNEYGNAIDAGADPDKGASALFDSAILKYPASRAALHVNKGTVLPTA